MAESGIVNPVSNSCNRYLQGFDLSTGSRHRGIVTLIMFSLFVEDFSNPLTITKVVRIFKQRMIATF